MFRKRSSILGIPEKVWDILGEVLAVLTVIAYALLGLNAAFPFITSAFIFNCLALIRTYGAILLVACVGFEALSKRNIFFQIIFLVLMVIAIITSFVPAA